MRRVADGVKPQGVGAKIITTKISKTGGIILEVDAAEDERWLLGSCGEAERRTPVLLLGIPE